MVKKYLYAIFMFGLISTIISQDLPVLPTPRLSQNTNNYIFQSSSNLIFISSTDGLNIYDGYETNVYRPATHNIKGYNIQGAFFEDSTGVVWFATYEALNYYKPIENSIDYLFLTDQKGDTIKSNYKVFQLIGSDIYLKAGSNVLVYDIYNRRIKNSYVIDFSNEFHLTALIQNGTKYLFGGDNSGYRGYRLGNNNRAELVFQGKDSITAILPYSEGRIWAGNAGGKISLIELSSGKILSACRISNLKINGIIPLSPTRLLISVLGGNIIEFDIPSHSIVNQMRPINAVTGEAITNHLLSYINKDSTLWISGEGKGVFIYNIGKRKMTHLLGQGLDRKGISVTRIIPVSNNNYIVLTRLNGIYRINLEGEILDQWNVLPSGKENYTSISGVLIDSNNLLFVSYSDLYKLNLQTGRIVKLKWLNRIPEFEIRQLERLRNGRLIASCSKHLLMEFILDDNSYYVQQYGHLDSIANLTTNFKEDGNGLLFVSNDEVTVFVLSPTPDGSSHRFSYSLSISGGIRGLADDPENNAVYITNTQGLFHLDVSTKKYEHIIDKGELLLQTIYSVIAEKNGNLWLGTNKGLLKYIPSTRAVKVFTEMDGIQGQEYNTNAYLSTSDGHMFFGGINGLNYFHPEEIRFSKKEAPVYFSELLVNEEIDSMLLVPQYLDRINLKCKQNTISFEFHAIDYSDPSATRVKYKMVGVDKNYVEIKKQQGFARYPNLKPGDYVFSVLGANADGHWNEIPKEISITINPPFYLTWWFILLSAIALLAIVYWIIRSYYNRKLEKKNQLLREQTLIIEKQQAVEHERTRIASEMHDDLGSGLTTIRYLSDKALTQAKDAEEAIQIKKIADHSNALVRNMSEIIWAMNARFDNADSLTSYLRRYASEYLEPYKLPLSFTTTEEALDQIPLSGERRRNIFLVFKETLHNTIKYSGANAVQVNITTGDNFIVHITEVAGKGFDPDVTIEKGNGIYNSRKRMTAIGGDIRYERTQEAMHIILSIPLQPTHNVQT